VSRDKTAEIVFLDDNEDLRQLMPIILKATLGLECLSLGSLMELQRDAEDVLRARLAILDINLGPGAPSGIDACNWLRDRGFRGKILFLTGHARSNPQVALAEQYGAEVLEKPLHPDQLTSFVTRALCETQ
jgi:DNA-binding NtrC family response regulator